MDNKNDPQEPKKDHLQKSLGNIEINLLKASFRDLYTYKKIEKICSAIHFVTNVFNEKEPLRMSLREKSIELISLPLSSVSIKIMEIRSLLQTAYFTALISEMNFSILREELDNLLVVIEAKQQPLFNLPSNFLHVSNVQERPQDRLAGQGSPLGQSIGHKHYQLQHTDYIQRNRDISKGHSYTEHPHKGMAPTSERSAKVISLLKDGKELTIKDFSSSIKGCSEKTLQRELLKLVAEGKIQKRGERRWSRYSLR